MLMADRSDDLQNGPLQDVQRNEAISVVLSDSSAMAGELLASALKRVRIIRLEKCAISSDELSESIYAIKPDVAIVSLHLSDGPYLGFKVLRQLRSLPLKTRFVMLLDYPERDVVIDAFRAGARGIFKKTAPLNHLYRCITAVHRGQIWASSEELQQLLEVVQTTMPMRCLNSRGQAILSKREQEIVPLVATGLTNKEISEKLRLSEHTVKNHLFRIYEKLGISSRVELILYAVTQRNEAA
jgi:DNA-binding NarL/FixJ family response regulator